MDSMTECEKIARETGKITRSINHLRRTLLDSLKTSGYEPRECTIEYLLNVAKLSYLESLIG